LADVRSGHNIRASVFVESHSMYKRSGPEHLRSIGEIEFAVGVAAMADSGIFGDAQLCAAIVSSADLRRGAATRETLEAQIAAGRGRLRGVRATGVAFDHRVPKLSKAIGSQPGTLNDSGFREGFAQLAPLGLSCDIFLFEPQIAELEDLAISFPDTSIVLNHVGMPIGLGGLKDTHAERFTIWQQSINRVAKCPNVFIKLGGLGNAMCGFPNAGQPKAMSSECLAEAWRPYIETCVDAFGPDRSMFESNYPVDAVTADYSVIWNAFKRIVAHVNPDARAALFSGTAARVYGLEL